MPTPETWATARRAYEEGDQSVSDIATALGVSHQAVSKRRIAEEWSEPSAASVVQAPQQLPAWSERAPIEAAAAGLTAARLRRRLMQELDDNPFVDEDGHRRHRHANAQMVRALTEGYQRMVQVASLLSGDPTDNVTFSLTPEDRAMRITEALAILRSRAIDTTSDD